MTTAIFTYSLPDAVARIKKKVADVYWSFDIVGFRFVCLLIGCCPDGVCINPAPVNISCSALAVTPTGTGAPTLALAASGTKRTAVNGGSGEVVDLQTCIRGRWIHSHEEDVEGVKVYCPAHYNFPSSRGRTGYDFGEGGKLVYFGIGAADGSESFSGSWHIEAPNQVRINVNSDRIQPIVLHVLSCDDQVLRIKG